PTTIRSQSRAASSDSAASRHCAFQLGIIETLEEAVASASRARRTERSDETYQVDRRGASTAQRSYRDAQQAYSWVSSSTPGAKRCSGSKCCAMALSAAMPS